MAHDPYKDTFVDEDFVDDYYDDGYPVDSKNIIPETYHKEVSFMDFVSATEELFKNFKTSILEMSEYNNAISIKENRINDLAKQFDLEFPRKMNEARRREAINSAIDVFRTTGTERSLKYIFRLIGLDVKIDKAWSHNPDFINDNKATLLAGLKYGEEIVDSRGIYAVLYDSDYTDITNLNVPIYGETYTDTTIFALNLINIIASIDLTQSGWIEDATASITDEFNVDFPAVSDAIKYDIGNVVSGQLISISTTLSGTGTTSFRLDGTTNGVLIDEVITLTSTPTEYTFSAMTTGTDANLYFRLIRDTGDTATTVTITNSQARDITDNTNADIVYKTPYVRLRVTRENYELFTEDDNYTTTEQHQIAQEVIDYFFEQVRPANISIITLSTPVSLDGETDIITSVLLDATGGDFTTTQINAGAVYDGTLTYGVTMDRYMFGESMGDFEYGTTAMTVYPLGGASAPQHIYQQTYNAYNIFYNESAVEEFLKETPVIPLRKDAEIDVTSFVEANIKTVSYYTTDARLLIANGTATWFLFDSFETATTIDTFTDIMAVKYKIELDSIGKVLWETNTYYRSYLIELLKTKTKTLNITQN